MNDPILSEDHVILSYELRAERADGELIVQHRNRIVVHKSQVEYYLANLVRHMGGEVAAS
jgi:hypothetical protein